MKKTIRRSIQTDRNEYEKMYIKLYADDFPFDVWEQYCKAMNISTDSFEVKINIESIEVIGEE